MSVPVCRERKDVRYASIVHEDTTQIYDEGQVAHYWWSLASNTELPLAHGGTCRVLFSGYSGGAAGPDVRDAVLFFDIANVKDGAHCIGDVEFHIRASDWVTHGHHTDSRYNAVLLHVVLLCDTPLPTLRQDGSAVPVCSLFDITSSLTSSFSLNTDLDIDKQIYPCSWAMSQRSAQECQELLQRAGLLRFEQKRDMFVENIHVRADCDYHLYLVPALAEGLAYGRDRDFFRAVALRLLGLSHELPEPLGRSASPSPLDATRLAVIHTLVSQATSLWPSFYEIFYANGDDIEETLQTLRKCLYERGISPARTDIVLCNVVLPFAAAVALVEHDEKLEGQARRIYTMHPGLVSNRVTRRMTTQLHLSVEPRGACRQQGLHYIYQQTCREKLCYGCIAGRERL